MSRLILLFARQPLFGEVLPSLKIHPVHAALLYHALLRDQIEAVQQLEGATLRICFAQGMLPGFFEGDFQWQRQEGDSAAERLNYALNSAFQTGATQVLALGLDDCLAHAEALWLGFEALNSHSACGGHSLRGFTRPIRALAACDSDHLADTAKALALNFQSVDIGLSYASLPRLQAELSAAPQMAPHSAAALASFTQA